MHVAEREVVVALVAEHVDRGGRVRIVAGAAGQAGMQHADVEASRQRCRIQRHQVLRHRAVRKAAAVHRDAERLQLDRLALRRAEDVHALDLGQLLGDLAFGIVVALDDEDADAGPGEPQHLIAKEQPGAEVGPVAVVDVAGQQHERHVLAERQVDQRRECVARGAAQPRDRCALVAVEPPQGTVDVEVGRMDEFHGATLAHGPAWKARRLCYVPRRK